VGHLEDGKNFNGVPAVDLQKVRVAQAAERDLAVFRGARLLHEYVASWLAYFAIDMSRTTSITAAISPPGMSFV
jgi:hypothetical protein